MSVKCVAGTSSDPRILESPPKSKVTMVAEDKFPTCEQFRQPTRNMTVYNLQAIPETDDTIESPPHSSTFENVKPPNPKTGLALRKLAALKSKEAQAKNNLK
jgi:hypothetical protein